MGGASTAAVSAATVGTVGLCNVCAPGFWLNALAVATAGSE